MDFKRHSEWKDRHAVLSASKYHWLNYTDDRLFEYVDNLEASVIGTKKHNVAKELIELRQKLPNTLQTLNMYVNDCIGYRMKPEQVLFYSQYAFGTADAISFDGKVLRIFDLKTGKGKVNGTQLVVYAAYFCLEYRNVKPYEIEYDLRIYQNDDIQQIDVTPDDVVSVMGRITDLNALITSRLEEV